LHQPLFFFALGAAFLDGVLLAATVVVLLAGVDGRALLIAMRSHPQGCAKKNEDDNGDRSDQNYFHGSTPLSIGVP
jgi:hypothetical protein